MTKPATVVRIDCQPHAPSAAHRRRLRAAIFILAAGLLCAAAPLRAQSTASSSAFGESVDLDILLGIGINSGPLPNANGNAGPAYNVTNTTASVNVAGVLSTGLLTAHAASTVPGSDNATADATVDNLALGLAGLLFQPSLLTLNATQVRSTATVSGGCGSALSVVGTTTLTGATIGGSAVPGGTTILASPLPNTVLVNVPGVLRITLNEQTQTGNGTTNATLTVRAVHIQVLSLTGGLGVLSGDIIIGQSVAALQCGPTPTPSRTATSTATFTATPTATSSATRTATNTATLPPTATATTTRTFTATPCGANPSAGTSRAYGELIDLTLLPILGGGIGVDSGPFPQVSGTTPPAYNLSDSALSATISSLLLGTVLQTGVLDVEASGGLPGANLTSATATVDDVGLALLAALGLGADVVQSTASVGGCAGALVANGASTITDGTVAGPTQPLVNLAVNPAPNTTIALGPTIQLILNEQIITGNGTTSRGITVNAIHLIINGFSLAGIGVLNGDIIIAHSTATLQSTGVPPTSTGTATPTATATRTGTSTGTATQSATATRTNTAPPAASATATRTFTATPCGANPSAGTSRAYGELIDLTLLPILGGGIGVDSGPFPQVSGTTPPAYNLSDSALSATISSLLLGTVLQTGVLDVEASGGLPGANLTSATATVDDVGLALLAALGLGADVVQSTASVGGCAGALVSNGASTITDGTVAGPTQPLVNLAVNPAPNTTIALGPTIQLILNEQIITGNGTTSRGITVNAIHLIINGFSLAGIGVLNGDIIIAHSTATLQSTGVPPTSTGTATPTATATRTGTSTGTATQSATATRTNTAPPAASATATRTFTATPCGANPSAGTSRAYGELIDLTLLPILGGGIGVDSGPFPQVNGTAPPAYNLSDTAVSASITSLLLGTVLQTGVLAVEASSGLPASNIVSATATVDDVGLALLAALGLGADVVQSTASVTGCVGALVANAASTITDGSVTRPGQPLLTLAVNPAPNTVIALGPNIQLILNEQILSGNGTTSRGIIANAIHLVISNLSLAGIGVLSGDIIIAHSTATLNSGALPTATGTATPTATATRTGTATLTATQTATATRTNTVPPASTATNTAPPVNTATATPINTATRTSTATGSATATLTRTVTPSFTSTPPAPHTATSTPPGPTPCGAFPSIGSSAAYGARVDLSLPIGGVTLGPLPNVSGTAPAAYDLDQTLLSAGVSVPLIGSALQTGVLTVEANGGLPGTNSATSRATVDGLDVDLIGILSVLGVNATTVQATASVTGCCNAFLASGQTTIVNGSISGLLSGALSANPAPNTVVVGSSPTLTVILNEQIVGGNGTSSRTLTVNAIHISLNALSIAGIGLVSGDIIIGQSTATLQCGGALPTATRTATATAVFTATATTTRTATATAIPATATATATAPPAATSTRTSTTTPLPATATATAVATATRTGTNTALPSSTATPTRTTTGTATASATRTATNTLVPSATGTATRTVTGTPPATGTATASATRTPTNTLAPSATVTATGTVTSTPPATATRTGTNTALPSATQTATRTSTSTLVPATATATRTVPATGTATRTTTGTFTQTPTNTAIPPTATRTATVPPGSTATLTPSNTATPPATASATRTATGTAVPPSSTPTRTGTNTAVPSATQTATRTRTSTLVPATATATRTATGTAVATASATASRTTTGTFTRTPTNTAIPSTATRTATVPPGSTATRTPSNTTTPVSTASATRTATGTAIPPSSTPTRTGTSTVVPSATQSATRTQTGTAVPSTSTPVSTGTSTAVPSATQSATRTQTGTAVPPSSTPTATADVPAATATRTATGTAATATATEAPVATATGTAVPPATNTATRIPSTPTATATIAEATAVQTAVSTATEPPAATTTPASTASPTSSATRVATATQTAVATGTATTTPLPPTGTPTMTNTPVSTPTATETPCQPPMASSSAFGQSVDLDMLPLVGARVAMHSGRAPFAEGSGTQTYLDSDTLPGINLTDVHSGNILSTGPSTADAGADPGEIMNAWATSDLDDVDLDVTGLAALLSLRAASIGSHANVTGTCCTGLEANGGTDLVDSSLDCLVGHGLDLPANPEPNTVVLDAAGMRVVLNEQILTGDAITGLQITVNAVHVSLDKVLVTGVGEVSGEIVLGRSTAELACALTCQRISCVGDCNRNTVVNVTELITSVNIALGSKDVAECTAIEVAHDSRASINELVQAVYNLLFGCPCE